VFLLPNDSYIDCIYPLLQDATITDLRHASWQVVAVFDPPNQPTCMPEYLSNLLGKQFDNLDALEKKVENLFEVPGIRCEFSLLLVDSAAHCWQYSDYEGILFRGQTPVWVQRET
jgi:hypothetical protein